jgi:hypothetical protein
MQNIFFRPWRPYFIGDRRFTRRELAEEHAPRILCVGKPYDSLTFGNWGHNINQ